MKKHINRLFPVFIILVACAIFFYPTFRYGKLPVPTDTLVGLYYPWFNNIPFKNFLITDPIRQQIPWRKLVIDQWKQGLIPSWNAYNFSGTPLEANIQAGIFYPFNILFFFLPFYVAWTLLIIMQPVLAAFFLYLYLRNKNILPTVAAFGGIIWAFCGFSIAWLTWGTIMQTALWLPLMLFAIDKSWILLLMASGVFAFFAGHAQVALYILAFALLYSLRKPSWKLAVGGIGIAIIASVQSIPMMRFLSHSARLADSGAWLKEGWFLPWQHLVQFIAPDFFGNPATLNYWGTWNYGEFIGYIGIVPLLLAIYALISRRDRLTRFFAVTAAMAFVFLLPTALAKVPFILHVPILSAMQPTRLMVIVDFSLAILAVLGLDAYVKSPSKKILFGIIGMGGILVGLWVYAYMGKDPNLLVSQRNLVLPTALWVAASFALLVARNNKLIFLVIVITVFDLFRFGWKFTPFTPVSYFFPQTPLISFLQSQEKPFRIMSVDNRILPPNVNAYFGIESIEGYDPIYDARYEEFMAALNRKEPNITPPFGFNRIITSPTTDSPLLSLLNVKYVLTLEELKTSNLELMYREGDTRVYWYKKATPRMYPVEEVKQVSSKQEIMTFMHNKAFQPLKTAIIEEPLGILPKPVLAGDTITLASYTGASLTAISNFKDDHFVVIANIYDEGWKATLDGMELPVYRTNYLFMGVLVPKGDHTIKLSHE